MRKWIVALLCLFAAPAALAQSVACPTKNLNYWQAFPAGGESDLSARHQQTGAEEALSADRDHHPVQAGRGRRPDVGADERAAGDGNDVVGVNLPHIVFQPIEGQVQYKTQDITPVFWFHYTPDALMVREDEPDTRPSTTSSRRRRPSPARLSLGGSGLNSANHAAHERIERRVRHQDHLRAVQGHRRHDHRGARRPRRRRDGLQPVRHQQQGQGARARGGDGQAPPAAARRADLPRAGHRLGRRRVSRHRRVEVRAAGGEEAPVRPLARASTPTRR